MQIVDKYGRRKNRDRDPVEIRVLKADCAELGPEVNRRRGDCINLTCFSGRTGEVFADEYLVGARSPMLVQRRLSVMKRQYGCSKVQYGVLRS